MLVALIEALLDNVALPIYCQPSKLLLAKFNVVPEGIATLNGLTDMLVAFAKAVVLEIITCTPILAIALALILEDNGLTEILVVPMSA